MRLILTLKYFHVKTWFINYDGLEKVILRHLKVVKKERKENTTEYKEMANHMVRHFEF